MKLNILNVIFYRKTITKYLKSCILLLLTDARAFPISSPELPGTAPRLAFKGRKKAFQLDPVLNTNHAM